MITWWNSLVLLEQIMACIAIPATLILLIQVLLILFTSFGEDSNVGDFEDIDDFDAGLDGLQIFTIKGLVSFFSIFGWSGLLFLRMGMNDILSIFIAFVFGVGAMVVMAFAFSAMMKLQDSGNIDTKTAIGVGGIVYMNIPANRTGMGKISAVVSGRYCEYDAVTDDENEIKTGSSIIVVALSSTNVLVVAKK